MLPVEKRFEHLQRICIPSALVRQCQQLLHAHRGQTNALKLTFQHLTIHIPAAQLQLHQQKAGTDAGGIGRTCNAIGALGGAGGTRAEHIDQWQETNHEVQITQHKSRGHHDRRHDEVNRQAPQQDQHHHTHQNYRQHQQHVELPLIEVIADGEAPQADVGKNGQRQNQDVTQQKHRNYAPICCVSRLTSAPEVREKCSSACSPPLA